MVLMPSNNSGLSRLNAEKSLVLASALFPGEEWIAHGEGVFAAKRRLSRGHKEQAKLYRKIFDAGILTSRGSVAYFLPEREQDRGEKEECRNFHADTVIGGYKQGRSLLRKHGITADYSVFIRLFTPFAAESARAKLAGELKNTTDTGRCICYFEAAEQLFSWAIAGQ